MDPADEAKIERTKDMIKASSFSPEEKEGLFILLDKAKAAANGAPDKIQALTESNLALCDQWIRHVLAVPANIKAEVAAHADKCPLKQAPGGKIGIALQFARSWPLMIAVALLGFSPWLPKILAFISEVAK